MSTIAIRAAKNRNNWGLWATRQYLKNNNCPFGLYRLACQLEAAKRATI